MDDILAYTMCGIIGGGVLVCMGTLLCQIFRDDCMSEQSIEQPEDEYQEVSESPEESGGLTLVVL
jgi:hypothetical protein